MNGFGLWKVLAIVAAFIATTSISLILYWRISSRIKEYEEIPVRTEVDKEALNRLREALRIMPVRSCVDASFLGLCPPRP